MYLMIDQKKAKEHLRVVRAATYLRMVFAGIEPVNKRKFNWAWLVCERHCAPVPFIGPGIKKKDMAA